MHLEDRVAENDCLLRSVISSGKISIGRTAYCKPAAIWTLDQRVVSGVAFLDVGL